MSDEGEDVALPSAEECDRRCQEFAQVTGTDEACGHFFLQDCDWDVQTAVNRYFESARGSDDDNDDDDGDNDNEESESKPTAKRVKTTDNAIDEDHLKVLSWNIDGLDEGNLATRTKAVCILIKEHAPDAVFLQEVVAESWSIISKQLDKEYELVLGKSANSPINYFTAMLLRRGRLRLMTQLLSPFSSSAMGRSLLQVEAKLGNRTVHFLTAHLESTKDYAKERVQQLRKSFDVFKSLTSPDSIVVFGGDLNVRDNEVTEAPRPETAIDVWEACGSDKNQKYTWDCQKNDNKHFDKFKPRCRFDRLYVNANGALSPDRFELIGMVRIRTGLCFPSDHWGLLASFSARH